MGRLLFRMSCSEGERENPVVTDDRRDPFYDWSRVYHSRDVVRLPDGRLAVVVALDDCSEDSDPPDWRMYVDLRDRRDNDDAGFWRCSEVTPAADSDSHVEAERLGLFGRWEGA
jgi:hypothetical protein